MRKATPFVKLFFCLLCLSINSYGQWSIISLGTSENVHAIDYFSANNIYITAGNDFLYSNNGGLTWTNTQSPNVLPLGLPLVGQLYDVKATNQGNLVSTGFFVNNNIQHILVSNNNGVSWNDWIYTNAVNPAPVGLNAIASRGNRMVAVGDYCKYGYSSDAGNTWSFGSLTTSYTLNDVEFISNDTVIAIGNNSVARSVNGGATWSNFFVPGNHASVSITPNYIYIADGNNSFLKSTNRSGIAYNSSAFPFPANGLIYAASDDTLFVPGDSAIYRSTNGGLVWEKLVMPGFFNINAIDYHNGELIAVGDSGFAIRNPSIANAPALPVVDFSMSNSGIICIDQIVSFSNASPFFPGYTYQWKLDGRIISNQTNATYKARVGLHTISLSITNQYGTVEKSQQFLVEGHVVPHPVFRATSRSICKGNYPSFIVPNSQQRVKYQLRSGTTNIGSPKFGTGDTLTFNATLPLNVGTRYNILAVGITSCFTDTVILFDSVSVMSLALQGVCTPFGQTNPDGITKVEFNGINNSSAVGANYSNFTCDKSTSLVIDRMYAIKVTANMSGMFKVWLDLNGNKFLESYEVLAQSTLPVNVFNSTIQVPDSATNFYNPIVLRVAFEAGTVLPSLCTGDGELEDYRVELLPAPNLPQPSFNMSTKRMCYTEVTFNNQTKNAISYVWNFGDFQSSTDKNPVHVYNYPGIYTVTLTATNPTGSASVSQVVDARRRNQPLPQSCNPALAPSLSGLKVSVFNLVNIANTSNPNTIGYEDYTCTKQAYLLRDSTYVVNYLSSGVISPSQFLSRFWVDWNGDGDFADSLESVRGLSNVNPVWHNTTVPSFSLLRTPLRLRVAVSSSSFNLCTPIDGEYEDYTLIIDSIPTPVRTAAFLVSDSTLCLQEPVQFTNTTQGISSVVWDFGDGTTSQVLNPIHTYTQPGRYTVKLIVCDSSGICDSVMKYNCVTMVPAEYNRNVTICQGQQYLFGSTYISQPGLYSDTLTSVFGCDSIIHLQLSLISSATNVLAAQGPVTFCSGNSVVLSSSGLLTNYRWYRNNTLIPSAVLSSYNASLTGSYYCVANDLAFCNSIASNSVQVTVNCSSTPTLRSAQFDSEYIMFPNPTFGLVYITGFSGDVDVVDMTGRVVFEKKGFATEDEIDLSGNPSGVYIISLKSPTVYSQQRLMLLNH